MWRLRRLVLTFFDHTQVICNLTTIKKRFSALGIHSNEDRLSQTLCMKARGDPYRKCEVPVGVVSEGGRFCSHIVSLVVHN
jgi:hypothetical protein